MFRSIALASASVMTLAAAANAADMYIPGSAGPGGYKNAPLVPAWAGFYIGVNGGYGWSDGGVLDDPFLNKSLRYHGLGPSGGFGGGQIGYNWQGVLDPHLVLGIEADIQGAGFNENRFFGPPIPQSTTFADFESRLDYFGTVRGRLGYAFGPSLLYATGGFAYGGLHNEDRATVNHGANIVTYKNTGTATGYAAGGGYEYKFNPAWSLKAEYQYINLGTNDITTIFQSQILNACLVDRCKDDAFHTVRAGLNYHFGTGYAPLK
jgi:outer membrane immunogenic protein